MTNFRLFGAAIVMAASIGAGSTAMAAPASPMTADLAGGMITHVAQGCGPGFSRGPRGGCRPMMVPRRAFAPRCVVRPTPVGPRRICR